MRTSRMIRLCASVLAVAFLSSVSLAQTSPAQPAERRYTWQEKLKRGALNIATSPVEIARQIHLTTEEENLLTGWTLGLARGFYEGFIRLGAGAVDLVTFPFDFPDSKKGPLIQPEYVWQKPGVQYT